MLARRGGYRRYARAYGLAVEMDSAGAALRHAAAELGAGHLCRVAQGPQDGRVFRDVEFFIGAVDIQSDHGGVPFGCMLGSGCYGFMG